MGNIKLTLTLLVIFITIWANVPCYLAADETQDFLELIVTNSRLPNPASHISAVYDGQDSIYLIGGDEGDHPTDQIVKYSVDSDQVSVVGAFTPIYAGSAVMPNEEEILYYGGFNTTWHKTIYKYSIRHGNYSVMATLPVSMCCSSVAFDSANQFAYLLGGNYGAQELNLIIRHNVKTNEVAQVGSMPTAVTQATAVWVPNGLSGVAYNFGGKRVSDILSRTIVEFDPAHTDAITLPVFLSAYIRIGCSVFIPNQNQAYIFGDSLLIRFDTITHEVEALQVEGWPALHAAGCVYVPRLGRMYIFGGFGNYAGDGNRNRDEIVYVQLDRPEVTATPMTQEPTTESSICPPDGIVNLPYPGNCTLYIRCFHGVPQILSCYPLRFDTSDLICKPVADAFCDEEGTPSTPPPIEPTTSQPDPGPCPPTGYEVHPHESNCSKYYECNDGVAYESDCATNTYFDINHEIRRCNQAELAVCNAECPIFGIEFQAIRARGCKWYKVCIEGYSTNLECGMGTIYDPEQRQCVLAAEYNCPFVFAQYNLID